MANIRTRVCKHLLRDELVLQMPETMSIRYLLEIASDNVFGTADIVFGK